MGIIVLGSEGYGKSVEFWQNSDEEQVRLQLNVDLFMWNGIKNVVAKNMVVWVAIIVFHSAITKRFQNICLRQVKKMCRQLRKFISWR